MVLIEPVILMLMLDQFKGKKKKKNETRSHYATQAGLAFVMWTRV